MRNIWWFAIAGGVVLVTLFVVLGFVVLGTSDSSTDATSTVCRPEEPTPSAGNAEIAGRAIGKGFTRKIVIRVKDKASGTPVHGADVSVQGTMTCPHVMPLIERDLPEVSTGTYRGDYGFIMAGEWTMHVVVRTKEGGATTSAFPLSVRTPG